MSCLMFAFGFVSFSLNLKVFFIHCSLLTNYIGSMVLKWISSFLYTSVYSLEYITDIVKNATNRQTDIKQIIYTL